MFKVTYNAPVTLTFVIVCFLITGLREVSPEIISEWFTTPNNFSWKSLPDWISLFTWVFAHMGVEHLVGNMILILLVGPMLEEKFGSGRLFSMILFTAVATALLNAMPLFPNDRIIGASGIVFMMIMLGSLTNFQRGEIPLTFLFVGVLFIGKELYGSLKGVLQDDSGNRVSEYAHIAGGILGSVFGFILVGFGKGSGPVGDGDSIGG